MALYLVQHLLTDKHFWGSSSLAVLANVLNPAVWLLATLQGPRSWSEVATLSLTCASFIYVISKILILWRNRRQQPKD